MDAGAHFPSLTLCNCGAAEPAVRTEGSEPSGQDRAVRTEGVRTERSAYGPDVLIFAETNRWREFADIHSVVVEVR